MTRLRHLTVTGLLSLTTLIAPRANAADDADSSTVEARPDRGIRTTGTFLVLFRCEPEVWRALFPGESRARMGRMRPEDFRVARLRALVTRLAGADGFDLHFASSAALFGDLQVSALATEFDNGMLLSATRWSERIELGVCEIRDGHAIRHVATWSMGPDSVLLLGLELEGEPYVVAIRCEILSSGGLDVRQREFREGTNNSGRAELNLAVHEVPPDGQRCLEVP